MANPDNFFKKGNPGKPQGAKNHITKTVKETVLAVFNELQEHPTASLKAWAEKKPGDFYQIAAKLIPTEINAKLNKIQLEIIRTTADDNTTGQSTTPPENTSQEPTNSL